MLDLIVILIILAAAVFFFIRMEIRKFKRLSAPQKHGTCCGSCENCPFQGHDNARSSKLDN